MKTIIALFMVLLAVSAVADGLPAPESQESSTDSPDIATQAWGFLSSFNPILLIVAGVVLLFASHLAKFIAIILIIVGVLSLLLSVI